MNLTKQVTTISFRFLLVVSFVSSPFAWADSRPIYVRANGKKSIVNANEFKSVLAVKQGVGMAELVANQANSESEEVELVNLAFEAQASFLTESVEKVIGRFEELIDRRLQSDWSLSARKIMYDAHFRLITLVKDPSRRINLMKQAYCFDSQLSPSLELTGPEINEEFSKVKKTVNQSLIQWKALKGVDGLLLNGKRAMSGEVQLVCSDQNYRVTFLSNSAGILDQKIQRAPFSYNKSQEGFVIGSCDSPKINPDKHSELLDFIRESKSQLNPSEYFAVYSADCILPIASLINGSSNPLNPQKVLPQKRLVSLAYPPSNIREPNLIESTSVTENTERASWAKRNWMWIGLGVLASAIIVRSAASPGDDPTASTDGF